MTENIEERAITLATTAHAGQLYGRWSYTVHLVDVVRAVGEFGCDAAFMRAAAWLHDSIEDTDVTVEEIYHLVHPAVAGLVHAVTDLPGATREERKRKTLPRIRAAGSDAVFLKLCDRIANVRRCEAGDRRAMMYASEHREFADALWMPGEPKLSRAWSALSLLLERRSGVQP